jgi:GMP synthase (glutamine-hydrolysing)
MKTLALRHVAFEDLGVFEDLLGEVHYRQAGVQPLRADEWLSADLVVVLGGPIGVYEAAAYPWMAEQLAGLRERLLAGRPTLGLCLGAQMIAAALGARVFPGPAKEIGWAPVELLDAGDLLEPLRDVPMLHWHGDTFELPADARWLARTERTPHQAFAWGPKDAALALQFHPEVAGARIEEWLIGHGGELSAAGIAPQSLRKATEAVGDAPALAGRQLLKAWLAALQRAGLLATT